MEKVYYFLLLISFANSFFSVWSLEKLNNKIYDMRDLYNQCVEDGIPFSETVCLDVIKCLVHLVGFKIEVALYGGVTELET